MRHGRYFRKGGLYLSLEKGRFPEDLQVTTWCDSGWNIGYQVDKCKEVPLKWRDNQSIRGDLVSVLSPQEEERGERRDIKGYIPVSYKLK